MNPTIEIFSQGDEIITGQTVDTNAAWLAQASLEMGFSVTRHTAVGDNLDHLIELLKEVSLRADCCVCTGGLGPTSDDLTAEAVAQAFSMPLQFDPIAFEQIRDFFKGRGKQMPDCNSKQALIPNGALRIDNAWGSAPGFTLQHERCRFFFLPGVPFEMRQLFNHFVQPFLEMHYQTTPFQRISIKTVGLGESDIQSKLAALQVPSDIKLGFRAGAEHVETKLMVPSQFPKIRLEILIDDIKSRLGDYIFGIDDGKHRCKNLTDTIDNLMTEQQRTVIFIETISQGLMTAKCPLNNPWLLQTHYQANAQQLAKRFAVDVLEADPMAQAELIADAVRKEIDTDLVLVQLFRIETATNERNHLTQLYNTLSTPTGSVHSTHQLGGSSTRQQTQAAILTLDLLRRYLQHLT